MSGTPSVSSPLPLEPVADEIADGSDVGEPGVGPALQSPRRDQLQAIVGVLNEHLPLEGEDPIQYWDVLARADALANDQVPLDFDVVWCTGPEWNGALPIVRGKKLRAILALAAMRNDRGRVARVSSCCDRALL